MAETYSKNAAPLLAGAATVDITPSGSVFLFGYPHVPRYSTGVHDPLECAALYLRNEKQGALFLANDLACFTKPFVAEAKKRIAAATGLAEEAIMLTATHTHSGPVMADRLGNEVDVVPDADPAYLKWLMERLVDAAKAAVKAAVPAEIGLTRARAEGVGTNRHDPAGTADPEVPVLVARSLATRQPIACMVVYSMHPTVMHEDSKLISADFPYYTRRFLRQGALPAECPIIYHNGVSGNQSPRHMTKANTFDEAQRLGELLGRTIAAVIPGITFRATADIRCKRRWLELERRPIPPMDRAEAGLVQKRELFARLKREGAPKQEVRTVECDVFGAERTVQLAKATADGRLEKTIQSRSPGEIQVIAIGPWKFVAWPGEFFVEYGLALKQRSPDTFPITLANGELHGYIVTEAAVAKAYYEATNAIFAPANGQRFVEATVALLGELG